MWWCGLSVLIHVTVVNGHGAVTSPRPRNAIDSSLAPWNGGIPKPYNTQPFDPWCPFPSATGDQSNSNISGANGQACFYFSNGCTIGCEVCDGVTRAPLPNNWSPRKKSPACANPGKATNCAFETRTVNAQAKCGSEQDVYYFSPWRAPGSAPVFDSCGIAGGKHNGPGDGETVYKNTTFAHQGDQGSKLPMVKSPVRWTAGSVVEVAWTIQTNHGGGYQYRLAPANSPLDEETFQKLPLGFVGQQALRWGGVDGKTILFDGVYLSNGTIPKGSAWAVNPVPINWHLNIIGNGSVAPKCIEDPNCNPACADWPCENACRCSGRKGPYDLEIVDQVKIPTSLAAGNYVLSWRWDCEESNQIWNSCSDVEVVSP